MPGSQLDAALPVHGNGSIEWVSYPPNEEPLECSAETDSRTGALKATSFGCGDASGAVIEATLECSSSHSFDLTIEFPDEEIRIAWDYPEDAAFFPENGTSQRTAAVLEASYDGWVIWTPDRFTAAPRRAAIEVDLAFPNCQ